RRTSIHRPRSSTRTSTSNSGSATDEARAILRDYTGLPEPVASSVALPEFDVEVRVDDLGRWIEVLREVDQFDGEVEPEDLVVR
ncbi:MAG TPA: hypothetical protein VM263_01000, partial [Acidimicrobiales bacterium]|nr:hypothetical protein [Acidimicrobiales bacterium]